MIFTLSGQIGVEPWAFTLREMLWMAEGAWHQPAAQMTLFANSHKGRRGKRYKPDDFNPFQIEKKRGIKITDNNFSLLKVFAN